MDQRRLIVVGFGIFVLLASLIVKFYQVQVVQHAQWEKKATAQHEGLVREPFRRGIFWTNGALKPGHLDTTQPLVVDMPKYHLHIDPASIPPEQRNEIAAQLEQFTQKPNLRPEFDKKSRNRQLVRWVELETHEQICQWWFPYARREKIARNAIFFVKDYQRSYPFGKMLGQVLHTIRDHKDDVTKQGVPTGGLEAYYNDLLQGKEGLRWMVRSPRHRLDMGTLIEPAQDGADIYLTINHYLQAMAEDALEEGVKRVHAKGGWAIIMQPHTGEILALAQYPAFYPENYRDYFNDEEKIGDTVVKGVTYAYEPGSVVKPLTMALCLKGNEQTGRPLFDPEAKIDTADGKVPGRKTPLRDVRCHGYLNMDTAIQKSSNIYMGKAIQQVVGELGHQWYADQLKETFGFGTPTRIQLPGETAGFLPRPGRLYPNGALEFSNATPYSLAMGYNLLVNSIQMVRAWAVLANGGKLVQPTLVKRVVKGNEVIFDASHLPPPKQTLSPQIVKRVVHATKFVTKEGGSAPHGDIPGYSEVGKSGTTEKLGKGKYQRNVHFSSFVGFTPAENPELVIMVAIDEPKRYFVPGLGSTHYGGHCAAPIFREIGKRALAYLGTPPDDPFGYPRDDPRHDPEKAHWAKEVAALREIYNSWNTAPQ